MSAESNKKQDILHAYSLLVAQNGIDKTSISNIAKYLHVPSSLIFYYFRNKDDLINQLWDFTLETYHDCFFSRTKTEDELDFIDYVQWIFLMPPYMQKNNHSLQHVYSCMQFYLTINSQLRNTYMKYVEKCIQLYKDTFEKFCQKKIITVDDIEGTAVHFECLAFSAHTIFTVYCEAPKTYDKWVETSIQNFCKSIGCSKELIKCLVDTYASTRLFQMSQNY